MYRPKFSNAQFNMGKIESDLRQQKKARAKKGLTREEFIKRFRENEARQEQRADYSGN